MVGTIATIAEDIRNGSTRALARALTWFEHRDKRARSLYESLYSHTGKAHTIGITGVPGSGKSTLTCALTRAALTRGLSVGIIAIDPTSPFSGGSILGDRIRMNDLTREPEVFIRSMATHGTLGGLCRAAADTIDLLDAAGKNLVIIETVGVGQDEVDIRDIAETVLVVSVPGLGDDIQMLKAGILEIADIHVVNKADRPGADRTVAELRTMLAEMPSNNGNWVPPILACAALRKEGIEPILDAILRHHDAASTSDALQRRRVRIAANRVERIALELVQDRVVRGRALSESTLAPVLRRELSPYALAESIVSDRVRTDGIERVKGMREHWEQTELKESIERQPESRSDDTSASGLPIKRVYTAEDLTETSFGDINFPGQYPFLRGPYPTMYRGRLWTMRQIAGFGTGEDTNARFRYLIEQGQTGLSVDFDMPTLMGYDSDDPRSLGEVGREGVAIGTLDDMEDLFKGIDLETTSVSMTINPTAWILLAMYVALAQSRGNDLRKLSGTVQADILKEYIAQKEWIFPIRPSMRLVRDIIVYCSNALPRYNPINVSGYHISEAGATAVEEVAFTMANGIAYVEEVKKSGLDVDAFAPRLAFYFVAQADFFEEAAKFGLRAAFGPRL